MIRRRVWPAVDACSDAVRGGGGGGGAAARADATGTTRLVFHLSAKGEVVDAEILKSSGEE
jgi:hypothetical protein